MYNTEDRTISDIYTTNIKLHTLGMKFRNNSNKHKILLFSGFVRRDYAAVLCQPVSTFKNLNISQMFRVVFVYIYISIYMVVEEVLVGTLLFK